MKKACLKLLIMVAALLFQLPSVSPAQADTYAYIGYESGTFGTVDLNTGSVTPIGPGFGIEPSGFGEFNGVLYTTGYQSNTQVYTVNTGTGTLSSPLSGSPTSGAYFNDFGSTSSGLYAASHSSLYSIDSTTGAATLVAGGNTLNTLVTGYTALSTGSTTLYYTSGVSSTSSELYTLNTISGNPTATMALPANMTALLWDNGILYGADESGNIWTINTSTDTYSEISNAGGAVWGLAPIPSSVPLPGAIPLLGPGFVGIVALKRKYIG